MRDCARYAPMLGAREGELEAAERDALAGHLAACAACRGRLADLAALQGMVGNALAQQAARRDFTDFADQVMARLERRRAGPLRAFFRRHRALVVGTALAPTLVAAALIVYLELRGGASPGIEVVSEQYAPMVIETDDGPLILIGDGDSPEGT
ncbi:MAG TPA: zf-HC2 domain-containing protein [Anaeromyxobacteraceae bacterium]|nr:zf-HC2 domain-containing protein [Anaeromyxobacteraceae bacterium]